MSQNCVERMLHIRHNLNHYKGRGRGLPGRGGPRGGGGYGGRGRPSSRAFHGTPGFMRNSERAKYGDGGRGGYGRR